MHYDILEDNSILMGSPGTIVCYIIYIYMWGLLKSSENFYPNHVIVFILFIDNLIYNETTSYNCL